MPRSFCRVALSIELTRLARLGCATGAGAGVEMGG